MKKVVLLVAIWMAFTMCFSIAKAATEAEIEESIQNGLAWLAAQQQADGGWPNIWGGVATTGLAVLALEHGAMYFGLSSPFDPAYPYRQNVENGLNYIFDSSGTRLLIRSITPQNHTAGASGTIDNPDYNGNGVGVYGPGYEVYDTGILLAAISQSGAPNRVVNVPGSVVNGWTYDSLAQDMVDWLAFAQADGDQYGCGEGGWSYAAMDNSNSGGWYGPDNSNGGYAVLGLAYSQTFGCTIPAWVKTELNAYLGCIQDPVDGDTNDGGSWYAYMNDAIGVNILKTGNLIFQMMLMGDPPGAPRVVDALNYLARHWGDACGGNQPPGWDGNPANYQAMFTTMKGLDYMGIGTFNAIAWYDDFSDRIVAQQSADGSWQASCERGEPGIITEWALLTLEKAHPQGDPGIDLSAESEHPCVVARDTVVINVPYFYEGLYDLAPVDSVELEVWLPPELDFVSATDSYVHSGNSVLWDIGTMVVGDSAFQQIVTTVNNTAVPGTPLPVFAQIRSELPSGRWDSKGIDVMVCPPDTHCVHAVCRDVTVFADSACMAPASIDSGSYDCNGAPITLTQNPPGPYPLGTTQVTLTVENGQGARDSCTATVTVKEVTPPHISVVLNKDVLWPPNHKMVDITATVRVTDDCCPRPTFMLVSITSNEPDNGKGDGNTIGDIKEATPGRPDVAFQLRAERSGTGTGRIYTIVYAAEDCSGNVAYDTVQVCVPHNGPSEYQDEQLPETPRVTALLPSYPNPFNPTTRIPFDLATKERVSLQIFDTQGRLVRTLCDEVMPEGTHEALWDGRDNSGTQVAAGVYFVRFTTGNYQLTKKLVMVR